MDSKRLVPKLRFPEFEVDEILLTRFGNVTAECSARKGHQAQSGPIMGVTKAEGIIPMQARLIGEDTSRYKVVQHDWFAYNPMRLNIGSIARWRGNQDILVSPDYIVFQCLETETVSIDPDYLDHYRKSTHWERFVTQGGDGGVRIRIYFEDLASLPLALPTLPEQEKISECLTSLDELIAAQVRKVEALRRFKRELTKNLFPATGETEPRLRFPEFRNSGDWQERKLAYLCHMKAGEFVPGSHISEHKGKDMFPCYGGNGLRGYVRTYTHHGHFALVGRQGALCGNVTQAFGKFHATEHALVATPTESAVAGWLYYALDNLNLNRFATGQAQPGLSVTVLNEVGTYAPEGLREQQIIADCLGSFDDYVAEQAKKLDALKTHKQGLMQGLFPRAEATER